MKGLIEYFNLNAFNYNKNIGSILNESSGKMNDYQLIVEIFKSKESFRDSPFTFLILSWLSPVFV